jgi:uncharacterized membrane protein
MSSEEIDTGRLEAFSDGVFAIAITLLIIEVGIKDNGGSLAHRLGEQWPSYVSFAISFLMIGIVWLNHHEMFRHIRAADHGLIVLNLALLFVVTVIPFPTKVVGDTWVGGDSANQRTAALLYAFTFLALTLAVNALWLWAARRRRLIKPDTAQTRVDGRTRRSLLGIPAYVVVGLIALWSPKTSIALDGILALLYLIPAALIDPLLLGRGNVSRAPSGG